MSPLEPRRRCILGVLAGWLPGLPMLLLPGWAAAQSLGAPRESAVKAAFLLNFTTFVEWPADALARSNAFVFGVYGDDAVAADLERLAAGRQVRGLPVVVRSARYVEPGERVHVAYIGGPNEVRVRELASRLPGPVLVVSHADAGLDAGAVLNFVADNARIRFEASQRTAEQRGLRLSSRLLAVAMAVEGR